MRYSDYYQPVMQPIEGEAPCGENLDYDPAFIMLQSRLQPKLDVEYGNFFEAAEPVNWAETERECQTLLQKGKDIRLIITLMRCRLRKTGLAALPEGLEALDTLLNTWPDELHPQLLDEGEFAPMLRANAFAELEDAHGLLADLRNQPLPKASGLQVTIKEFEKAHIVPREDGTMNEATVAALIHEWHLNASDEIAPLTQAWQHLQQIKKTLCTMLGHEAPDLGILEGILQLFSREFSCPPLSETASVQTATDNSPDPAASQPADELLPEQKKPQVDSARPVTTFTQATERNIGPESRTEALQRLQEIRHWFAMTEPSSPLTLLLKYAEESIGKNFAELIKMYPPEIIAMINKEKD